MLHSYVHQFHGGLHDTISNRRDSQRSLFAASSFPDVNPFDRFGLVGSLLSHASPFPDLLPSTTPIGNPPRIRVYTQGLPDFHPTDFASFQQAHRGYQSRIMFICHYGRSGSFRCSPPRLTATQLLQVSIGTTATNDRGLPPRKRTLPGSALVRPLRGRLGRWLKPAGKKKTHAGAHVPPFAQ